jgi:hypothetical protein
LTLNTRIPGIFNSCSVDSVTGVLLEMILIQ